jgi:hypothetical protein
VAELEFGVDDNSFYRGGRQEMVALLDEWKRMKKKKKSTNLYCL